MAGVSLLFYSQDIACSTSHSTWIVTKGDKVPTAVTEHSIARNIFLLKLHPQEVASTTHGFPIVT